MTVRELMQTQVFAVGPNDPLDRVYFLLHYEKIRHLPVLQKDKVIGMVSDRDLYKSLGPKSGKGPVQPGINPAALHVSPRKVRHIMRRGVLTIEPQAAAAEAAAMMAKKKIGALPVVDHGKLVGILTATDLLGAFARLDSKAEQSRPA